MERAIFAMRGRVVHANGAPAARVWVSVVDADSGDPDDLLGLGLSNDAGEFRVSFTTEAFNQEPHEREMQPDIYFVLAMQGNAGPVPVMRHHVGSVAPGFDQDVGALMLPLLPVGEPPAHPGLRHAPEIAKAARRLHLDDGIVGVAAREIAPIVESLTGWSALLDGVEIRIVDSIFDAYRRRTALLLGRDSFDEVELERLERSAGSCDAGYVALWEPTLGAIFLNRPILERWSLDVLKVTLGHELVHVGQSRRYPELHARQLALQKRLMGLAIAGGDASLTADEWRTMANIEGYAHYIENKYLLAIYTHGRQLGTLAPGDVWERYGRRPSSPAEDHAERLKALSPKEMLALPKTDNIFTIGKSNQYEAGFTAYLARTTDRPAAFDPALQPELTIDDGVVAALLVRAAENCAVSQQALGWLMHCGEGGIEKNDDAARAMLRMAAENGLPSAAYLLASLLPDGDPEEERWFRAAAVWGLAAAQRGLARVLLQKGTPHYAPLEAVTWLEKAADQDDLQAMLVLAGLLLLGEDVPVNHAAALRWATTAAERESVEAMRFLEAWYAHGVAAPPDLVSARLWKKRADAAQAKRQSSKAPVAESPAPPLSARMPAPTSRFDLQVPGGDRHAPGGAWALAEKPLILLVAADFTGREDRRPVEDRKEVRVSAERFEKVRSQMKPADTPRTAAHWSRVKELCALFRDVPNTRIELFNLSYDDLHSDFEDSPSIPKSGLYKILYSGNWGHWIGSPIAAFVFLESIPETKSGTQVFAKVADVCARSHAGLVVPPSSLPEPLLTDVRSGGFAAYIEVADPVEVVREMMSAFKTHGLASVGRPRMVDAQVARQLKTFARSQTWKWTSGSDFEELRKLLQGWLDQRTGSRPTDLFRETSVSVGDGLSLPCDNYGIAFELRYVPNPPLPASQRFVFGLMDRE